ncbi:TPA: hypothetical protein JBJ44_03900 [Legionella pneumophila]|nr:hypothetical protein [Legionella pneumophila]
MKVILLLGPSSAGKSTLCAALVKEHGWYTHGVDQVGEILQKERTPLLLRKLREHTLIDRLSPYMNESAITRLAETGQLELTYKEISIRHQFKSPDFQGLETILSQGGFTDKELKDLSHLLHEVGTVFETCLQNPIDRMMDDIFKLPPDASVIIDEVPPIYDDLEKMLHDYKEKLLERATADSRTIEYATVLAFCPPKALSKRIHHRNESAVISGNIENKREGVFPFLQLSQLISTSEIDGAVDEARTLSKLQLLIIALQHLPPNIGEGEAKKAKAIFKAGAHEYRELMKKFRLSEATNVAVLPREDLGTHVVLDLSQKASPSEMAKELIAKTMDTPLLSAETSKRICS